MSQGNTIFGPGFSVELPPGFTLADGVPMAGVYRLLPPGVTPFDVQAMLQIRPVQPFELQPLLQSVYALENPAVAMTNAMNLGLVNVTGMMPVRQVQMPQGPTQIREFEGV